MFLTNFLFQLFETCLSPNTNGDGTGCDNMTAVIVQFKPSFSVNQITARKRAASVSSADVDVDKTKRVKTDANVVIEEKEEETESVTTS